ncbi:MAG: iron-sulfur cluster repair di-iron protein [Cyclobacteriaceae bacterium]
MGSFIAGFNVFLLNGKAGEKFLPARLKDGGFWHCPLPGQALSLATFMATWLQHQSLHQLVNDDHNRAYVLHYLGIPFCDHWDRTLAQACQPLGIRPEQVEMEWRQPRFGWQQRDVQLAGLPLDLIIQYLKHTHTIFVKHKLPYIGHLVDKFRAQHPDYDTIEKDMKVLYPLFREDFIHHIYEEEDTLFSYIQELNHVARHRAPAARLYFKLERYSLQQLALDHEVHDDEMAGIRKITNNYCLTGGAPLHVKVLYSELQQFETALQNHARVENEILFPHAMTLESQVRARLFDTVRHN